MSVRDLNDDDNDGERRRFRGLLVWGITEKSSGTSERYLSSEMLNVGHEFCIVGKHFEF